jgi:hypothetical protein
MPLRLPEWGRSVFRAGLPIRGRLQRTQRHESAVQTAQRGPIAEPAVSAFTTKRSTARGRRRNLTEWCPHGSTD